MSDKQKLKDRRIADSFFDRRSGDDRREGYEADYFANGGLQRERVWGIDKSTSVAINMFELINGQAEAGCTNGYHAILLMIQHGLKISLGDRFAVLTAPLRRSKKSWRWFG